MNISIPITTVYHGSTHFFNEIDVSEGKPYKDFGRGFYVTYIRSHAAKLALRNKQLEKKFGRNCNAYLYTFDFDKSKLSKFKVKEFKEADLSWLKFVIANRKTKLRAHNFDVVIGPTADDDTMAVINIYLEGFYGEIGTDDALSTLLRFIKPDVLPKQIYFATNESTMALTRSGGIEIL